MRRRAIHYSAEELAWLEANYKLPIGDYLRAFSATFGRDDVNADNLIRLRLRNGWKTGRTGLFEAGNVPKNKGVKCAPGRGGNHPNSRQVQFKKGRCAHSIGQERISDGYVEICVGQPNPHNRADHRYVRKHRWLWEQANGPIPAGHSLKCLDSNRLNTDPANWELIPDEIKPALLDMAYDAAVPEIRPAIMVTARLRHRVRELRNERAA